MYGANRASSISAIVAATMVVLSELGAIISELSCIRTTPFDELAVFIMMRFAITNSMVSVLYRDND